MESLKPSPSLRSAYITTHGFENSDVSYDEILELSPSIDLELKTLCTTISASSRRFEPNWLPKHFTAAYKSARFMTIFDNGTPASGTFQLRALCRAICLSTNHINVIAMTENFIQRSLRILLLYSEAQRSSLRLIATLSLLIHALKLCPEPALRERTMKEGKHLKVQTLHDLSSARLASSRLQQTLPSILCQISTDCAYHKTLTTRETPHAVVAMRNIYTMSQEGYCPESFHLFQTQFS